jgi:hypothetical protein
MGFNMRYWIKRSDCKYGVLIERDFPVSLS